MPTTETGKLYGRWLALWNGDYSAAAEIVADACTIHHPNIDMSEARTATKGGERIAAMVRESRALFEPLEFSLEVGPIEEDGKIAARWIGRGNYRGGLPGAKAETGAAVSFAGIDIFRVENGKVAEYWVSSDALHLMQQLGVVPRPKV